MRKSFEFPFDFFRCLPISVSFASLNGSDEPIAIHRKIGSARPRKASSSSSSSSSSLLSPPQADAKGMEEYRSDKRKSRHTTAGQSEKSHDGATIMSPTPTTGRGDGSVDKQSDPSHDLSRTGLEGGDKGKGKRKWTGREDRGSSSESIPEDSGEDGKAAPVERPEQGNEMKEGHPVEEERAALSHVDDDDIGYDERVPPSLPAFEEPRPPLVGEHENHEDGVDVDMGLSDERREKQPRPSVGGEDHREAAHGKNQNERHPIVAMRRELCIAERVLMTKKIVASPEII